MAYIRYSNGVVKKDDFVIPVDEFNRDWIEYKAWVDAGNPPEFRDASEYLAELVNDKTNFDLFKAQYKTDRTTLQGHIDETNWKNAKIINAVVFQSRVLLYVIRIIAKRLL